MATNGHVWAPHGLMQQGRFYTQVKYSTGQHHPLDLVFPQQGNHAGIKNPTPPNPPPPLTTTFYVTTLNLMTKGWMLAGFSRCVGNVSRLRPRLADPHECRLARLAQKPFSDAEILIMSSAEDGLIVPRSTVVW